MSTINPDELKKLVKGLQGASNDQETIDVLTTLKKEARVTEALLRESKAGLAVGKLRSHANGAVSSLAKEIVKQWKDAVAKDKGKGGASSAPKPTASVKSSTPTSVASPTTPTIPSKAPGTGVRNSKTDGIKAQTSDNVRSRCIELIYDGLAFNSGYPSDLLLKRAEGVEKTVLEDCKGATPAYKNKIRSLFQNLKDKNNGWLRDGVGSGDITPATFARMTTAEMASAERKAEDAKIAEENMFNTLAAGEMQAETDAFQCGRCKQRKCRYRQAQTRSADEPMTTFVTCTNCNHRWKFS
ncbi:transcription elongation factor [Peniophora sp. CONT]|nr:transcription elongation factor [Peniophora sp. CONT]